MSEEGLVAKDDWFLGFFSLNGGFAETQQNIPIM